MRSLLVRNLTQQYADELTEWIAQRQEVKKLDNDGTREKRARDTADRLKALGWTEREYDSILWQPEFRPARPLTDRAWPALLAKLEPFLVRLKLRSIALTPRRRSRASASGKRSSRIASVCSARAIAPFCAPTPRCARPMASTCATSTSSSSRASGD